MTKIWPVVGAAALAFLVPAIAPPRWWDVLAKPNHRGRMITWGLWIPLAIAGLGTALATTASQVVRDLAPARLLLVVLGGAIVVAAGVVDDLAGAHGPRGIRGHLQALARGTWTTGQAKVAAAVVASLLAVLALPRGSVLDRAMGLVLIAAATNLWNGLDVAPGRAAKAFVLVVLPLAVFAEPGGLALRMLGATAVVGWADLRERGMLGDAGATLLGFSAGLALYEVVPAGSLWVAAGAFVLLNALAETVTLSRIIRSTPPLRWVDDLGRLPLDEGPGGAPSGQVSSSS
jgi:hypothetical protein